MYDVGERHLFASSTAPDAPAAALALTFRGAAPVAHLAGAAAGLPAAG
eukprot:CAMPEP_0206488992 /NCGR_PEP_ID=MMETSP0324_2-20121206/42833_1 /ASSEMBLY_ACC=CAM_ASM_000836 /TAXON_ID=2866 /ORGANISM="Crypthecodinium cohnii, Strain Seligo" /LENGTH=47 /DNA_ID= /DNA_START= /DNA_END= /DNA_ORIENTATION=